ncbi:MAG: FAD-binding domain-containing protein [Pseudomonadota bacterium]
MDTLFPDDKPETFPELTPSRSAGLNRLAAFAPRAGSAYRSARNTDFGPDRRTNVSVLSPYIRHRLVLETDVLAAVLTRHSLSAAEKFVQEVYWRTYFKGWLEQRPAAWQRYQSDVIATLETVARDNEFARDYEAAINGQTGIDCMDAWARELVETGYLHNHARMWFASIWIFTLKLPWILGADFFLRHLLDGDPASNTLGWRWVAGLHTKGKTYLARADNIERHTDGRFNPRGLLATRADPLIEPDLGPAVPLAHRSTSVEPGPFGLLITEEDCAPETLPLPGKPEAVLGLTATTGRSPGIVAGAVKHFAQGAVHDALARFDHADQNVDETENWGETLIAWAQDTGLSRIVTAEPPVGPVAARLAKAAPMLSAAGIEFVQVRRLFDAAAWPHATKGFFALKAKIPNLLKTLPLKR